MYITYCMFSSSSRLRPHTGPQENAMLPPAGLHHEGHSLGPPPSEQDGGDGNPLGALPLWVDDGTLAGWCAESVKIYFLIIEF